MAAFAQPAGVLHGGTIVNAPRELVDRWTADKLRQLHAALLKASAPGRRVNKITIEISLNENGEPTAIEASERTRVA